MASGPYSFIDIAVLDEVRARFAAGDALAILTVDLEEVIWANGPGAALFGHSDIESVMGASPGLSLVARRQIAGTPGFPRMGRDRQVGVRLTSGLQSRVAHFLISQITLPDGEPAVLLAFPAQVSELPEVEVAARIIDGFVEAGYFAALLDEQANLTAATHGFSALGIAQDALTRLVDEVSRERDRLVKRLIPVEGRLIPAGIARLTDEPALHLLIAIDETVEEIHPVAEEQASEAVESDEAAIINLEQDNTDPIPDVAAASVVSVIEAEVETLVLGSVTNNDLPEPSDADLLERLTEDGTTVRSNAATPPEADDWYFGQNAKTSQGVSASPPSPAPGFAPKQEQPTEPVRFIWRTDAAGAFSALSSEFVSAVGMNASDVIGQSFKDVAIALGIDQNGEIANLLERRDTWSGRSVSWPIVGTSLAVPVDLAALPVYSRDREFEGFRGFGVARMGDASADPAARGMALGGTPAEQASPMPAHTSKEDPFQGEAPVISITGRLKRRESDKVIRLAEHRPTALPGRQLSPGERNAFEEIRARLQEASKAEAKRREDAAADAAASEAAEAENEPAEIVVEAVEPEVANLNATIEKPTAPEPSTVEEAQDETPSAPVAEQPFRQEPTLPTSGFTPSAFACARDGEGVEVELIGGLPLPLLVHTGDELHFANREFLTLTGYLSLEQMRAEGGLDSLFIDKHDDAEGAANGQKLIIRAADGEEFPVDAHLQSTRWQGRSALLLALRRADNPEAAPPPPASDSRNEESASQLAAMERRVAEMRTIIDTATDGVVLIARDGTIRNISRPAEALFGFDSATVEGKDFATLFAIESHRSVRDYLSGLTDNGVASLLNDGREVIGREAEGRFIPLFMTIGRLPGDSGFCAVVRDITQWKRAEEDLTQARAQAERASSQKTEFLARVSHEIRTPLNAIIGFSELMMDEKFGPIGSDRYRDYLRDINRSGNHVLDLVNDLLDISKIEAGEQEMQYEAVSLNDTLAECVAMMQPQANRERVIIRSSLASRLPEVVADLRSVRQIALNLLSNAIRFTQPGGQVIVSTGYEQSGDVVMRVRDTGIGMSLPEIDQALKPFKQINALKRGRHDGTGLGLPLTKAMVEANRARFSITSTPGDGTMVEITFPSTRVLAD